MLFKSINDPSNLLLPPELLYFFSCLLRITLSDEPIQDSLYTEGGPYPEY